ncbi:hypothetical protein PN462_11720, partial [Spirulina sp. CS-785/01]
PPPPPHQPVARLHQLTVYTRWFFVFLCWLLFAPFALWSLREDIELMLDYFTWAALRYSLAFNPIAAFCLAFCIGLTTAVLIWQSRNIIWGISPQEQLRLQRQAQQILSQGKSHPLWRWVNR